MRRPQVAQYIPNSSKLRSFSVALEAGPPSNVSAISASTATAYEYGCYNRLSSLIGTSLEEAGQPRETTTEARDRVVVVRVEIRVTTTHRKFGCFNHIHPPSALNMSALDLVRYSQVRGECCAMDSRKILCV